MSLVSKVIAVSFLASSAASALAFTKEECNRMATEAFALQKARQEGQANTKSFDSFAKDLQSRISSQRKVADLAVTKTISYEMVKGVTVFSFPVSETPFTVGIKVREKCGDDNLVVSTGEKHTELP